MGQTEQLLRAFDRLDDATLLRLRRGEARFIEPMRARLTDRVFSDPAWLYERKLDGERILAVRKDGQVTLYTRNRKVANAPYPELVRFLQDMGDPGVDFVMDGEVVALVDGKTSFSRLQRRMQKNDPRAAMATGVDVHYFVFDLLNIAGHDTLGLPLRSRRSSSRGSSPRATRSATPPIATTTERPSLTRRAPRTGKASSPNAPTPATSRNGRATG